MYQVTKILKSPDGSNAYGVDRSEVWRFQDDKSFETYAEAEKYIIDMNVKQSPQHFLEALMKNKVHRKDILNDEYLFYRKYFIGPPPKDLLKQSVENQGIKVLK